MRSCRDETPHPPRGSYEPRVPSLSPLRAERDERSPWFHINASAYRASSSSTAAQICSRVKGFSTTRWISASRLCARCRSLAKPVISRMRISGWSLLAFSASAMPSRLGMTMSVSSSSKRSPASAASAAEPSGTTVTACPPCWSARETKALTALSSSATRIFATRPNPSAAVGDGDFDHGRRLVGLGDAGAKGRGGAGQQPVVVDREFPGLERVIAAIEQGHLQLRHPSRDVRDIDHLALNDQGRQAVLGVADRRHVVEVEAALRRLYRDAEHLIVVRGGGPAACHLVPGPPQPAGDDAGQHHDIGRPACDR